MSRGPRISLLLLLLLAVAAASACTVTATGRPAPAGAGGTVGGSVPLAYDEQTARYADAFARVRTVDTCALHDVAAAERITGAKGKSLRLGTGLTGCDLEVETDDPAAGWEFRLDIGMRDTDGWKPIELGGTQLLKQPSDSSTCHYHVPIAENVGLKIETSYSQAANSGPEPSSAKICQTSERYLADVVLSRWKNPPQLADGLTGPRSPLLGKNPCAALAAAVADVAGKPGEQRTYSMTDPYSCQGGRGTAIKTYSVEFTVFSSVIDLKGRPVKIGDFAAFPAGAVGLGGCSYEVAVKPDFVFSRTERTVYHAGIVIGVPTCDDTAVVQKVLDNLVQQPDAPEPKPGAQVIGDLRNG